MKTKIPIIISIILSFALVQCAGDFSDVYEKGRYVEENPPAPDTTPPLITKAEAVESNIIDIEFSEVITEDTAQAIENYYLQGLNRLEIIAATLKPDGKTVALELAVESRERRMKNGMEYTVLVQNVTDTAGNPIKYAITKFFGRGWVVAEINSTPLANTNSTSANITVAGTGIIAYQYSIDGGPWSTEILVSVDPEINLTGLSEGYHTLKVVGQKTDGEWQEINYATVYGWNIDITAPVKEEIQLLNTPDNVTEDTTISINIKGNDVTAYQYEIAYRSSPDEAWTIISTYNDINPVYEPLAFSALVPGQYMVSIIGRDSVGNWQDEMDPSVYEWTIIPKNAIVAVLYNLPEKLTPVNRADITVGGLRILYYKYRLDGGAWTELTGLNNLIQLKELPETTHTLEVTGTDEFGITQENPTSYSWTIDNTAPTAVLSNTPSALTSSQFIHIIVSGDQVVKYRYKIDNSQWSGLINSAIAIDISGLIEGNHVLYVSGVDEVGNEQKEQFAATSHTWNIDITPPTAVLAGEWPWTTPGNDNTKNVIVVGASVTGYKYKLDNSAWSGEIAVATPITLDSINNTDGSHQLYVIGRDSAGNWQDIENPTTCAWIVDTTPTTAILSNAPNNPTPVTSIDITVVGPDVVAYSYKLDNDPWSSETDAELHIEAAGLSEEEHTLLVIAKDSVGNLQVTPTIHTWTIDTFVPEAVLTVTSPAGLSYPPAEMTNVTSISIDVSGTDIESYKYRVDWGEWSDETLVATPISKTITVNVNGGHTIHVRGKKTGEIWQTIANATVFEWIIDTFPPTASLSGLPNNPSTSTSIDLTVGGVGTVAYKYAFDPADPDDIDWDSITETSAGTHITESGLAETSHSIYVIARDAAGNWQTDGNRTSYTWTVDLSSANAVLTNVPDDPTSSTSAAITVGPPALESYMFRYSTNGSAPTGAWSAERAIDQYLTLDSLPDAVIMLQVIGKDIYGNWQDTDIDSVTKKQWRVDTSWPMASLSNTPANPTASPSINVTVGTYCCTAEGCSPRFCSSEVVSYKYKLDSESWSSETAVGTSVSRSGLTEGYHRLYVIGKSDSGIWQQLSTPTTHTWLIDYSGPEVTLANTPPSSTTNTSETIWVSGSGVTHYKYALDNPSPAWGGITESSITNSISLSGLGVTGHSLRVIGRDTLENWGPVKLHEWTVTYIQSPASYDTGSWDSDPLLRFSWTNPANTGGVRIQVATDPGFSNIVFDSEIGNVEFYNYIADQNQGTVYYAKVKVKDTSDHWSEWGTASNGIYLSGSISGKVRDTNNTNINGATIALYYMSGGGTTAVTDPDSNPITATTNGSGDFSIPSAYIGTNYFRLTVSIDTRHAAKNNITVVLGEDTNLGIIYIVPAGAVSGILTGKIVDANDGSNIQDAVIKVYGWDNQQVGSSYISNSTGDFSSVTAISPGTYSIVISKVYPLKNYFDLTVDNIVINDNKNIERQAICEVLSEPQVRVIILWGPTPTDLDLHLVGPTDNADTGDGNWDGAPNNRFHVGWYSPHKSYNETTGLYVSNPGDTEGVKSTSSLVQDDTTSYGPEAINIFRLGAVQYDRGVYTYTIHNWSNQTWVPAGYAITMRVYDSIGMAREINFPSSGWTGANPRFWKAIKINIQGIGRSKRTIYIINQFADLTYNSKVSMDW